MSIDRQYVKRRATPGVCRSLLIATILLAAACDSGPRLSPLSRGDVILAFGDSLTYGTGVTAQDSYPSALAELTGMTVIRSGVPGEISAAGKTRLESVLTEHEPDLVILCHGGNDVLRRLPARKAEQNLRDMIDMVRASGAEVALIAVPGLGLFPEPLTYYETIGNDMNVPIEYDILSDLMANSAMKSDRVHFNGAGYRRMAEAVHELLISAGAL